MTPARLRLRLERALDTVNSRRVIEQLDEALARKSQELHELNKSAWPSPPSATSDSCSS